MDDLQLLRIAVEAIHRDLPSIARQVAAANQLPGNDTDRLHALLEEVSVYDLTGAVSQAAQRLDGQQ